MKVIIIDDEPKARVLLRTILEESNIKSLECFEAEDLVTGVAIIKKEHPSVVFLDIEMPEYSGLDILEFFEPAAIDFEIIFTTAYSEYALKAFELSAIDYLLKPLRPQKVLEAFNKVRTIENNNLVTSKLEELKQSITHRNFTKIALPVSDGVRFANFESIIMLEADGMYTKIYIHHEDAILISKPLKYFTELLVGVSSFYRPHRSYLINMQYIKQYVKSDGGYIIMDNDRTVLISKDKRAHFLALTKTF